MCDSGHVKKKGTLYISTMTQTHNTLKSKTTKYNITKCNVIIAIQTNAYDVCLFNTVEK